MSAMGAVGAGVMQLGQGVLERQFARKEAEKDRNLQRHGAASAQAFSAGMASTQYQRAAADLSAAGLNRILAIGSPSASPMGAQPSASRASPVSQGSIAEAAIHAASAKSLIAQQNAQTELLRATKNKTDTETKVITGKNLIPIAAAELGGSSAHDARGTYQKAVDWTSENIMPTADDAIRSSAKAIKSTWNRTKAKWNTFRQRTGRGAR